ncbi:c2h2 transcription factor [Ophiostoma piceae UAMH 11346]|uniref:C2H2 type master regulator of conidiophore development brlA n=1 Tax=Ophiostoma piceae (strain UAMH 11346) TaxID=1262450 RepID=S3CL95_OPHP1|nr:c2h2 transcription factor [Ophiostoma piceae UAMH 11346]
MNKYCQPDSPDSVNDLNDSKRIDIVSSYCDKMTSPNAYPSPDPSSSPFVYYPSANMFEVGLQSSPDINTVDPASPVHLLAPTPSHAHPKSSVCSPASSMRSTPTAGQYPVTYAATPSSKKKVCDTCKKAFNRRCDLNRHNKTHERPFKCQSEGCEYQTRGFPTDQERKRHLNDRHSDAPVIYDCTWEGCNYSSKRESNLKQHKEKAHDWKYDRSRPNNRSRTGQSRDLTKDDIQLSSTGTSPFPAPSTYPLQIPVRSQAVPPFAGSDVTSSLDYTNASRFDHQHDSNNALFMMGTHITNHGVYTEQLGMGATTPVHVAWEEPATENQLSNFLVSTESQHDSFSTTHPSHHNQQGHAPHSWTYNNPDLLSPAHGTHAPVVPSTPNAIPAPCLGQYPFAGPVAAMPFAGRPMVPSSSLPILQDVLAGDTSQAAGTQSNAHTGRTSKRGMGTSCHEGHRRNNRSPSHLIPGTSIPFDEDSMPCPFRVTDPAYYSRVNQERFSPCHTEHRYISTLL